jgi:hypothetical protein
MLVHLLTNDTTLSETLGQALGPETLTTFTTPPDVLNHMLQNRDASGRVLLIDLAITPDVERFIFFVASTPLRSVPIVTIGSAKEYASLNSEVLRYVLVTLRTPENAADLGIVVSTLRAILADRAKPAIRRGGLRGKGK